MTEQILEGLQQGVVTVVLALIGLAVSYAITYINKLKVKLQDEANKLEDDATRELATSTINRIGELAIATVSALEQEYGKAIRDSIACGDGEFTRDDLIALHSKAVESIKDQLTDTAYTAMQSQINDVEGYISTKVSEALFDIKSKNQPLLECISAETCETCE